MDGTGIIRWVKSANLEPGLCLINQAHECDAGFEASEVWKNRKKSTEISTVTFEEFWRSEIGMHRYQKVG